MKPVPILVSLCFSTALLAGCLGGGNPASLTPDAPAIVSSQLVYLHDALNGLLDPSALPESIQLSTRVFSVGGNPGPEPSLGVTSNGDVFFQASEKTFRSQDHGRTWARVLGPLTATSSSDPYLWVDPTTDRVFQVNMGGPFGGRTIPATGPLLVPGVVAAASLGTFCSHIAWSDDQGRTWLANPIDCGPVPMNDHEKLATGPWVGTTSALQSNPAYPNAVYYAYNKGLFLPAGAATPAASTSQIPDTPVDSQGGWMAVSFDGGATFPQLAQMFPATCSGGLHGAVAAAPDGTVYVPARNCPAPLVAYSQDNGRTWKNVVVGQNVGVPEQQKNPEIAVDAENNAYLAWTGKDNRLYLTTSQDHAGTWSNPIPVSPPSVGSTVWPTAVAGDKGRVGFAYIGTEENTEGAWNVTNETRWHLYYTYTLNALEANPTFVTIRATDDEDPVQRGTICVQSNKCKFGNRNLLDFIDLVLDQDGRPYVAFADGCTTVQCLRADATPLDSRDREAMVMVLQDGPSLLVSKGTLRPL